MNEILFLCFHCDIICLQKQWQHRIAPQNTSLLSSIHSDFIATGIVHGISYCILVGRAYDGTGTLCRKSFNTLITTVINYEITKIFKINKLKSDKLIKKYINKL